MKKTKAASILLRCALVLLGGAAHAASPSVCPPKPCCEPVVCPPMQEDCCIRNVCTPTGRITPNVDQIKGDGMDWFIIGDYTYWTAREENLEYALEDTFQGVGAAQGAAQGRLYRTNNPWVSGFKAGLGTDFCRNGWDINAFYTWFKSDTKGSTPSFSTVPGFGVPLLLDIYWNINSLGDGNSWSFGEAHWRLNLNVVDLELGRNFYVSPRLMVRPFYGFKGVWTKQRMDVVFDGVDPMGLSLINSMANKMNNWGIGARAGMDTSWHFTRNFSLIGDMAFTALWEQFKVHRMDTVDAVGVLFISIFDFKENQYAVKPVIEWMMGLKWESGFSCDAYHLALVAGWEQQLWFGQNKFLRLPATVGTGGDLTLQGLTVDVRFDF